MKRTIRVLLVDDEEELVSTLAERLSLRGLQADWAATSEDALEIVERAPYDVVVLDVKIPGMSGLELKKRLESKRPATKFIFITGHGSEKDFKVGIEEAGPDYYLVKPVKIEVLVQKINELQ